MDKIIPREVQEQPKDFKYECFRAIKTFLVILIVLSLGLILKKQYNDMLKIASSSDERKRLMREQDEYRKRMIKEKAETAEYANSNLLADLLDSLDNFDRTVEAGATATDVKSVVEGIKMINCSLVKMLEDKYGLAGYRAEGDEFNPDEHEAIGRMEDEKAKKETLAQVYLKGYKLKDKVIRHAKVMVSVPKA